MQHRFEACWKGRTVAECLALNDGATGAQLQQKAVELLESIDLPWAEEVMVWTRTYDLEQGYDGGLSLHVKGRTALDREAFAAAFIAFADEFERQLNAWQGSRCFGMWNRWPITYADEEV